MSDFPMIIVGVNTCDNTCVYVSSACSNTASSLFMENKLYV